MNLLTFYKKLTVLSIVCLCSVCALLAQEESAEEEASTEEGYKNMISVEIGHAHVSEGVNNGETEWLVVPSWAINYNRILNHQWKVGLHTDIILEEFIVRANNRSDEEDIERSHPISMVAAASYKPIHWLSLIAGAGAEYAPEETFTLIRLGLEPGIEISHRWELVCSMVYDIKVDAYNNWTLGVGVARLF